MEPIQITGRAANSDEIRYLARQARQLEYDNLLPVEIIDQLDPNGNHLLFPREVEGETTEQVDHPEGYTKVTRVSLTLQDAIPCQLYLKLKGRAANDPFNIMMDVSLEDMMKLHTIEEARRLTAPPHRIRNGEYRGRR